MAVDTLSKRISALRKTLPFPDGTIVQGDRQHVTWNYAGILALPLVRRIAIFGHMSSYPIIGYTSITLNEDP